ncbi:MULTISPECIES: hypothetical protein [Acetobacter]|uniref:hypothetical protein n=1 Tax=Acetobacter TaxID=434 RepID=UPI0005DAF0E5|nr:MULTISPECIES: hypothetical protein [Acetobacter]GAN72210.1 hypothetical protein Absy_042_005 [Acetobacter syzygii]GBR64471.1 hypothetical protein AA0483_1377 [Acetobacter syzygii NRIC 0483]GEL57354.1 hypothetical protein ASY01nite_24200 [Acetobacter syzygii]
MAKGESGRVVVELDPFQKRQLYSVLAIENKTLKDWMIERIQQYLSEYKGNKNEADHK